MKGEHLALTAAPADTKRFSGSWKDFLIHQEKRQGRPITEVLSIAA